MQEPSISPERRNRLDGRVAIVTGAGQGIGRGIAQCLARAGADVILFDVDEERVTAAAESVGTFGTKAIGLAGSVTSPADVDRVVRHATQEFGHLDVFVNNAGIGVLKPMCDQTDDDWDAVLAVNLKGVFLCCRRAAAEMTAQRSGAIVNIASIAAFHYTIPHVPYAASKAGVVALTRDLAYEVAADNVRVNAVAPGPTETPFMIAALTAEQKDANARSIPLGRLGTPEDIGEAVAFLASDAASFITGVTLTVSGGTDLRVVR
jgi:NAD(P)-dependent dehydrogenase (short-subunit alcohol dehydrogenase family)